MKGKFKSCTRATLNYYIGNYMNYKSKKFLDRRREKRITIAVIKGHQGMSSLPFKNSYSPSKASIVAFNGVNFCITLRCVCLHERFITIHHADTCHSFADFSQSSLSWSCQKIPGLTTKHTRSMRSGEMLI